MIQVLNIIFGCCRRVDISKLTKLTSRYKQIDSNNNLLTFWASTSVIKRGWCVMYDVRGLFTPKTYVRTRHCLYIKRYSPSSSFKRGEEDFVFENCHIELLRFNIAPKQTKVTISHSHSRTHFSLCAPRRRILWFLCLLPTTYNTKIHRLTFSAAALQKSKNARQTLPNTTIRYLYVTGFRFVHTHKKGEKTCAPLTLSEANSHVVNLNRLS